MSKTVVCPVQVAFGDCDPAGIVFFPNFLKWMDTSSHHFFLACGLPPLRDWATTLGVVGHPVLEVTTRFHRPATYGDNLQVHTTVEEWREKVFVHNHTIQRDGVVLCEGRETRAFVTPHPDDPSRLKSVSIPDQVLARCRV